MNPVRLLLAAVFLAGCEPMVHPTPPTLLSVEKLDGGLMVRWKNTTLECSAIEGERKTSIAAFERVFSVAGDVTSRFDATATADTTYGYRLRCKKDNMDSDYCPEMSGNPVK